MTDKTETNITKEKSSVSKSELSDLLCVLRFHVSLAGTCSPICPNHKEIGAIKIGSASCQRCGYNIATDNRKAIVVCNYFKNT